MTDSINVVLTIRKVDQRKFEAMCNTFDDTFEVQVPPFEVATFSYAFDAVNDAKLDVEQELQEKKIPYEKSWDKGGDYNGGILYHRVDENGESVIKEFYEGTEGMVALDDIVKAFDLNCVDKLIAQKREAFHIISWK